MAIERAAASIGELDDSRTRPWLAAARDFVVRRPLGALGAAVVIVMFLVALLADLISPYNPVAVDFAAMLSAPSAQHWLGTDAFGRDVLSRLIHGSRTALLVGFGAAFFGATIDRKSTRLNSSHIQKSRMPSSA